jgi:hypothetical protein
MGNGFDSTDPSKSFIKIMESPPSEKIEPIIGEALICGYASKEEIEEEWTRAEGKCPCPYEPCRFRRLDRLRPINELWKILGGKIKPPWNFRNQNLKPNI